MNLLEGENNIMLTKCFSWIYDSRINDTMKIYVTTIKPGKKYVRIMIAGVVTSVEIQRSRCVWF